LPDIVSSVQDTTGDIVAITESSCVPGGVVSAQGRRLQTQQDVTLAVFSNSDSADTPATSLDSVVSSLVGADVRVAGVAETENPGLPSVGGGDDSIAALVGGIVGALVLVGLLGFLAYRRRSGQGFTPSGGFKTPSMTPPAVPRRVSSHAKLTESKEIEMKSSAGFSHEKKDSLTNSMGFYRNPASKKGEILKRSSSVNSSGAQQFVPNMNDMDAIAVRVEKRNSNVEGSDLL